MKKTTLLPSVVLSTALILSACSTPDSTDSPQNSSTTTASQSAVQPSSSPEPAASSSPSRVVDPSSLEYKGEGLFDFESHRGGRGENTESSAAAFTHSLDMGVTTLELDIVLTKDNVPLVWHDPEIQEDKCSDTSASKEKDSQFPYVGKLVHDLNLEQIKTLNCDKVLENFPTARPAQGNKILTLDEFFNLVKEHKNGDKVRFNIETKIEADKPKNSATPEEFFTVLSKKFEESGMLDRIAVQSFDWRVIPLFREWKKDLPINLLWDDSYWKPQSPWTGSVDYDQVKGDIIAAAKQLKVTTLSPGYAEPYGTKPGDADYHPVPTPEFVKKAHEAGLKVVPWTVNDESAMKDLIANGVDGIITDYPTRLKQILDSTDIQYLPEG